MNKVNARRLHDLDKFETSKDTVERVDNQMFDFLNRESSKSVFNPYSAEIQGFKDTKGDNLFTSTNELRGYQEVHVKDYISPLEQFSKSVVHNNTHSNPHRSLDPLIHKLNAIR